VTVAPPSGRTSRESPEQRSDSSRGECAPEYAFVGRNIGACRRFDCGSIFRREAGGKREQRLLLQPLGFKFEGFDRGAKHFRRAAFDER